METVGWLEGEEERKGKAKEKMNDWKGLMMIW